MPTVEPAIDAAPLNQGDILQGVTLFATEEGWNDQGGKPARAQQQKLCVVVSRPCVTAHKDSVVVAAVDKYPDQVPREIDSFKKVLDFLTSARDGGATPDVFYLGHIPGLLGRYRAKLDSLHTIALPTDPAQREAFVRGRRIASLHIAFCRALHTRIFTAFANQGFDDYGWASNEDLRWLADAGRTELLKQEMLVSEIRTKKSSLEAQGKTFAEKELKAAEEALEELRAKVQPYLDQIASRAPSNP